MNYGICANILRFWRWQGLTLRKAIISIIYYWCTKSIFVTVRAVKAYGRVSLTLELGGSAWSDYTLATLPLWKDPWYPSGVEGFREPVWALHRREKSLTFVCSLVVQPQVYSLHSLRCHGVFSLYVDVTVIL